ncbi:uncharacterized protein LOC119836462 [Zerene cesonia]|uniref:uncharacterized protein LOC119836462 n=1 Tax=Zerene cesonia TaxID=33412 RepID=UPI0018E56706|nr:uncharacterized protein LOC119836462 [Zerene cesonia]
MDSRGEYHDPDYPEAPVCVKAEPPNINEEEKVDIIKKIIHREFSNEVEARENEVLLIDQRMTTARRYLHQLRYTLVNNYYKDQRLQLTASQINDDIAAQAEPTAKTEVARLLRDGQRRLHPSVRKLLGKKTADLDEIFKFKGPRNKTRIDYSAMLQTRNYTISADSTKTLRPEMPDEQKDTQEIVPETSGRPRRIPRHIEPKIENVLTLDEITRNKMKHRYRIIIGNTSKYVPPASRLDRSTHKWLLYVRGPAARPDLSALVTAVTARLHHSYAPHHVVHLRKPPFHISRRGWGEFPVSLELHFPRPDVNRPAALAHTIALDRHYTGLQTLGAETVVDVWLYSTPEMLKYEYKDDDTTHKLAAEDADAPDAQHADDKGTDDTEVQIKPEPNEAENHINEGDSWLDFFANQTAVSVDDMLVKDIKKDMQATPVKVDADADIKMADEIPSSIEQPWKKRIMKYMDPTTGKIYYLEMDRKLDLSTVQEIVINSKGSVQTAKISPVKNGVRNIKKGVSLLKPEVKSLLNEHKFERHRLPTHIENDHCYLGFSFYETVDREPKLDEFKRIVERLTSVRQVVKCLLKKIPLISAEANKSEFVKCFPFVVENEERYWKLDFAKRRNIEWSRAKLINKLLVENFKSSTEQIWRTKQILVYARLHGFYPTRPESVLAQPDRHTDEWSSWNDMEASRSLESSIKEVYPSACDISSLSIFDLDSYRAADPPVLADSDEEIDVVRDRRSVVRKQCDSAVVQCALPVTGDDERHGFVFVERKCADIGLELRNEDVGHGYSYSAVHAVLLSAVRSFAEDLIRESLAVKLMEGASAHHPPPTWSGSSSRIPIHLQHVYRAAQAWAHMSNSGLATNKVETHSL